MNIDKKEMKIVYWEGGLFQHEVEAIEKIKESFSEFGKQKKTFKGQGLDSLIVKSAKKQNVIYR
ncbi:hypothetical protein [Suttonella ornithocola]|uniref:Uncharacterized protein n=1 Tax=Suttonella ornithocola TaxID=279832 RepID=A0A380MZT1_9GAMM|nr:hypothetical protein [Suttonella ornithocola]SUO97822.1 Uncharacterised protein [Suttonella ornithocola]